MEEDKKYRMLIILTQEDCSQSTLRTTLQIDC